MTDYRLLPARPETAFKLAKAMRGSDIEELLAGSNHSPIEAILQSLEVSSEAWEGWVGDDLICMFGVGSITYATGAGSPWMLGTDAIGRHFVIFARVSRLWITDVRARYGHLHNYVYEKNTDALRWLSWLGFTVLPATPHGPHGLPFCRVELEGDVCAIRPQ